VILVGEDPASQVYVRTRSRTATERRHALVLDRPARSARGRAAGAHPALNADPSIHGILVQMPLPAHIDAQGHRAIAPAKDVDGFHGASAGALMTGLPGLRPCTPYGCMKHAREHRRRPAGKHAVVIGPQQHRGQADGPAAAAGARHRHHLPQRHARPGLHTRQADIVVAAVGRRNTLSPPTWSSPAPSSSTWA
jgi:methylenetetrahydrofolate dehydrogenase (NADP+)/methenyltetrahydrofolate cyclohydrolase